MGSFQIFSASEIENFRKGGDILKRCLREVAAHVRPGITTGELNRIAEEFIASHKGATPGFKKVRNYPCALCISVNEECVHGIPGDRVLADGDIVSIDGGVLYGGLNTDACITVPVGTISPEKQRLLEVTERALENVCGMLAPGVTVGDVSACIQKEVEGAGFSCVHHLTGHGLGKTLHQFPDIPNVGEAGTGPAFPAFTVVAVEPITAVGKPHIVEKSDGWTIATADGSASAHFEHTFLLTPEGCEILA